MADNRNPGMKETLFGDAGRTFGTVSAMLLVFLAIAPAKNHFSEWRHYQKQYLSMVKGRGDALTLQRHFQGGIQQIWIPELGVVDRCQTCHVGLKEATLGDVKTEPFRKHPPIPHSLNEFGCVTCHRGQGAATTVEEAHSSTKAWEEPLLPAKYLEASCGQCHAASQTGTPQLNQGRKLLASYGCVRCHSNFKLSDGKQLAATDDPPSLEHIGDKTSREWVYAWLKNPQAYSATATMPNFQLSDNDAADISAFIMSQSTPVQGDRVEKASAATADALAQGPSLYGQSFCASCHAVQNASGTLVGGNVGPELTKIGSKVKPEWLEAWLRNPDIYDRDTAMPHYRFNEKEVGVLAGFLEAKTDSDLLANVHLSDATPDQIAHGKRLVTELGCASCHEINGLKRPDNFAPDLTKVGSRSMAQLVFADGVPHTLPDYIAAKVRNPRAFGPGLKMPQFTFTPTQIDALTTALLAQTDRAQTLPVNLKQASIPQSHYQPAGKAGQLMNDLRCFSCHAINGRGGDMAPDLTWEGSSVQRSWLADFLKNPNTLRPALIRRMPKFNLTPDEINTLTDYMMTVYQTPAFDRDSLPSTYDAATVEKGRQLFYSKYACQSCHIADFSKDKGYIGPALAGVGLRLTPAWMYHWLKDPQALRPGTIEPNRSMPDDDARALTAFLTSLKARTQEAKK